MNSVNNSVPEDLLTKLNRMKELFALLLPTAQEPDAETLRRWAWYEMRFIEKGITRAAARFGSTPPPEVHQYITGVARSEQQRIKENQMKLRSASDRA